VPALALRVCAISILLSSRPANACSWPNVSCGSSVIPFRTRSLRGTLAANQSRAACKWSYLYRAVDKHGKTVDFLLRPDRGIAAAQAFFRKALSTSLPRWPHKITLDGQLQSHLALRLLRREDPKWKYVEVRSNQYLNNLIEQDHRAIKRRCAAMVGGFKSFGSAAILARAWSISEFRVAKADLGTSTRVVFRRRESQTCRFGPELFRHPKFERL
jgi:hypothetical protein